MYINVPNMFAYSVFQINFSIDFSCHCREWHICQFGINIGYVEFPKQGLSEW
jgi:hypothetical protein